MRLRGTLLRNYGATVLGFLQELTMHKHIRVHAALCIIFVIASTSATSAQTSLNEDELPTGDVWISHAESVFVPREAPGTVGEVPSADATLCADVVPDA